LLRTVQCDLSFISLTVRSPSMCTDRTLGIGRFSYAEFSPLVVASPTVAGNMFLAVNVLAFIACISTLVSFVI
jgi:hypothetical protein